jgi:Flp pilus assembly protein TadB
VNVIVVALLGAGAGLGLHATARALAVRPEPIDQILADLARPRTRANHPSHPITVEARLGASALRLLRPMGLTVDRHRQNLELIDRTPERHVLDKLLAATAGLLVPNLIGIGLATAGIGLPAGLVAILSLGTAAGGFVLPDLLLVDAAEQRRRAFRHALSSYLDLTNVLLAGGAGIETALYAAADAGEAWGYSTIRSALREARLTGQPPWDTFAALANRLGVNELAELAASVSLAGSHGARIRASLAAKADTLRGHQVAETEAAAEAATERMTIPVAVLLFGFLLFIGYPAVSQITSIQGPTP